MSVMKNHKTSNPDLHNKAIKVCLYPDNEQIILFSKTFGCCRKIWNLMLADKNEHYKIHKKILNVTPALYKSEYPYLKEVDSLALANVQLNLNEAFRNFFNNRKHFDKPKFKSKKTDKKKYTTNLVNNNIDVGDNFIKIPKIGVVKAKIHRKPLENWVLKSITVS